MNKQEIEKGCGKYTDANTDRLVDNYYCGNNEDNKLCPICQAKLQQRIDDEKEIKKKVKGFKTKLDEKAIQLKEDNNFKTGLGCDAKWVGNILDDILFEMKLKQILFPEVLMELKQHLRFKGNDNTSNFKLWKTKDEQVVWADEELLSKMEEKEKKTR